MNHSALREPQIQEPACPSDSMPGPLTQAMAFCLHRLGREAYDERGALTTEMMILTAVLCLIAVAAYALLNGAMGDAAEQIDVNIDSGG